MAQGQNGGKSSADAEERRELRAADNPFLDVLEDGM